MSPLRKRLTLGASLLALAAATPFVASDMAERAIRNGFSEAGVDVARVDVSIGGSVTLEGLTHKTPSGQVSVGRIEHRIGLAGVFTPALAQAGSYSIDNLAMAMGAVKLDIPKIVVEGGSFSKDDIPRIFALDAGMPARVKTLSAKSVSIPEMRFTGNVPEVGEMSYVARNTSADNIQAGRVDRVVIESTSYSTKGPTGSQKGTVSRSEVRGMDLTQVARVYFETAKSDEKPAPVYDSYVVEGMKVSVADKAALEMEIGKVWSGAMRMRPLKGQSLVATVTELMAQAEKQKASKEKPDAATMSRTFDNILDLMDAVEDDGMTMENMRVFVGDKAKPDAALTIAKVEGSIGGGKMPAGYRVTGIDVKAPDTSAKIASIAVEGFSYAQSFRGMAEAFRAGDPDMKRIDPRRLIPKIGTISVVGIDIDAADPKSPKGIKPERIVVKLGKFLLGAKDQINGIPTKIDFAIENLAMKLPEHSSEEGIRMLRALGYPAIDMSAKLSASWVEAAKELQITEISVGGVGMGKARISGTLGNIGREVFEADAAMAQVALMGATAKAVNLQLDNAGLAEKAYAMQAKAQSRKPDDLRKELGTMAALGIPAVLGASDAAKAISGAVAKFLAQPKSLKLDLTARNAAGVGIPDMVTVKDPQKALELVNVSASAD